MPVDQGPYRDKADHTSTVAYGSDILRRGAPSPLPLDLDILTNREHGPLASLAGACPEDHRAVRWFDQPQDQPDQRFHVPPQSWQDAGWLFLVSSACRGCHKTQPTTMIAISQKIHFA
jgi:hypothetical protein